MQDFLPFIVIGIATGAVYGLAGVGLVLAYKTSGIFNLAYGAIAALTVFVFYWLHDERGWPWGLAAVLCVFVLGPAEGLLMELLGRALEQVGATLKVVATVGLLLIVLGVGELLGGLVDRPRHCFAPSPGPVVVRLGVVRGRAGTDEPIRRIRVQASWCV